MTKLDEDTPVATRRARWGLLSLLLACMIVVGGILVWQMTAHSEGLGGSTNPESSQPAVATTSPLMPPVPLTALYDETVEQQVAQRLHLTVAKVTAQLQAQPTPDLRGVGKSRVWRKTSCIRWYSARCRRLTITWSRAASGPSLKPMKKCTTGASKHKCPY